MKVTVLKDAARVPIDLDARRVCVRPDAELIHLTFAAGQALETHANPFDVVFYVLEGAGELEVWDERRAVTRDTAIEVPAGVMRGWRNTGKEDLRVLVIKLLGR